MEVTVWFKIDAEVAANKGEATVTAGMLIDIAERVKDGEFYGTLEYDGDIVGNFSVNN